LTIVTDDTFSSFGSRLRRRSPHSVACGRQVLPTRGQAEPLARSGGTMKKKALKCLRLSAVAILCCFLARAAFAADDLPPCRAISDRDHPRFSAVWVTVDGIWVTDDLNHSLILFDRLNGDVKKIIRGLRTELDFPVAVQVDPDITLPDGKKGGI